MSDRAELVKRLRAHTDPWQGNVDIIRDCADAADLLSRRCETCRHRCVYYEGAEPDCGHRKMTAWREYELPCADVGGTCGNWEAQS